MRYRDAFLIALVAGVTILVGYHGSVIARNVLYQSTSVNRDDARATFAFPIPTNEWAEYQVLRDATTIRLLTNAALSSVDAPDHDLTSPRQGWRYSLAYELLDIDRQVIDQGEYHFRTQVHQLLDAQTKQPIYPIQFGKSGLVAAQTRPMQLSLLNYPTNPGILRVRLQSADAGIREVVGRSLCRIERVDYEQRYTWTRLSKKRRELICRYTVYQPDLLTELERTNLLRWRWTQTSTLTGENRKYLYFVGGFDDQQIREEQIPAGLYTDPNWKATIPVPEGRGVLRLEFDCLDRVANNHAVQVRWYGLGITNRDYQSHPLRQPTSTMSIDVDGGLVEIDAPVRLVARAFWRPAQSATEMDVTPVPLLIKTYVLDEQTLDYAITHQGNAPTPLRLGLRYPFGLHFRNATIASTKDPAARLLEPPTVTWEFLDRSGEVIDSGQCSIPLNVSPYDHLRLPTGPAWVTEPSYFYFAVPAAADRIRLRSHDGLLLAGVAVRPIEASRSTRIPEDYHVFHRRESDNCTWYSLHPPNSLDLVQANRSFIVLTQDRPPEDNEELLAGQYQWKCYHPKGRWVGRQLLIPRDPKLPIRESSSTSTYFQLTPGSPLEFQPFNTDSDSGCQMIVIAEDAPGRVELTINGVVAYSKEIRSSRSQIDLTGVNIPDSGVLTIQADQPASFFFSGRLISNSAQYIKRTAQKLAADRMEFDYQKTNPEEMLTVQLYRSNEASTRCTLRVTIDPVKVKTPLTLAQTQSGGVKDRSAGWHEGILVDTADGILADWPTGILADWTLRSRIYDLRPQTEQRSLLLGSDATLDVGHRCYVRLGSDLPAGNYRICVERIDGGHDGHVVLYQTVLGANPIPKFKIKSLKVTP